MFIYIIIKRFAFTCFIILTMFINNSPNLQHPTSPSVRTSFSELLDIATTGPKMNAVVLLSDMVLGAVVLGAMLLVFRRDLYCHAHPPVRPIPPTSDRKVNMKKFTSHIDITSYCDRWAERIYRPYISLNYNYICGFFYFCQNKINYTVGPYKIYTHLKNE